MFNVFQTGSFVHEVEKAVRHIAEFMSQSLSTRSENIGKLTNQLPNHFPYEMKVF
jgi:hypothetical protein